MNVTLVNMSAVEVPLSCTEGEGWVVTLEPGAAHTLDDDEATVVTVGDNPTLREDITDFLDEVRDEVLRLVTFWRQHAPKREHMPGARPAPVVKLTISNAVESEHGLRVMQGDDRSHDFELQPGESGEAEGLDYIEIRELGTGDAETNVDQAG